MALLAYVRSLLPEGASVDITGDCEFGAVELMRTVNAWGWWYALRQKPNHQVIRSNPTPTAIGNVCLRWSASPATAVGLSTRC